MTNYRRAHVPGATYFFTVNLADRSSTLLIDRIADLRSAVQYTRRRLPFVIDAMAILPDHLHAVWTTVRRRRLPASLAPDQESLLTSHAHR